MIEAKGLRKTYNSGKSKAQVLKGIDLNIEEGKFVAVIGPSGAGKSTLLHILGGLDTPDEGKVFLNGQDLYRLSDPALAGIRNKSVGFVFQFYHLLPEFTAIENVCMPALINPGHKAKASEINSDSRRLLSQMGLEQRLDHFPSQLSGGEQQRVAIARSLINKPQFLFCDEPTGNLDSKSGSEIIALIRKINVENGMTVVLVTHNIELAESADRIYHLTDGILVS